MPWPPPECQAAGGEVGTGMLSFAVADVTVWERKRQNSLSQLLAFVPLTLSFTSSQDPQSGQKDHRVVLPKKADCIMR